MRIVDRVRHAWQREPFDFSIAGDLFVRDTASASGILSWFVIASLPVFGLAVMRDAESTGLSAALLAHGLPLVAALAVSLLLHVVFAIARNRVVDPAWFLHGWLFALLAPIDLSLPIVALGMGFGVVVGSLIFGGTGRYLVSPALLGIVFVQLGYPGAFAGADADSAWRALASGGTLPDNFLSVFLLQDAAHPGGVSAAACMFGAFVLYSVGAASLRVVAGALMGAAGAAFIFRLTGDGSLPASLLPQWHWILGSFAFCTSFILTDPSVQAATRVGRWLYGGLAGALVITLRVANPEHPEGTFAAFLFAALFAPLIDQLCQAAMMRRWRRSRAR